MMNVIQYDKTSSDIVSRFSENPILNPKSVHSSSSKTQVECLLNPGVFKYDGLTWLLIRVAEIPLQESGKTTVPIYDEKGEYQFLTFYNSDPRFDNSDKRVLEYNGDHYLSTLSHLRLFSSQDGILFSPAEEYPAILPQGPQETFGIEDCRVSFIDGAYHLTYTQVSATGVGVGLMTTKDWKSFDRKGMIFPAHNKDCALFEEKINDKYYALHRPSSPNLGGNYIWIAESPDLEHWGKHQCLITTRKDMWDSCRVGAGAAPIKTEAGWLEIYHGADADHRYCLGALLLDLEDPTKVLARSEKPIMEPIESYEQYGFFGNVVFTNGHLVEGDQITLYYGASDEVICGGRMSIKEILKSLNY